MRSQVLFMLLLLAWIDLGIMQDCRAQTPAPSRKGGLFIPLLSSRMDEFRAFTMQAVLDELQLTQQQRDAVRDAFDEFREQQRAANRPSSEQPTEPTKNKPTAESLRKTILDRQEAHIQKLRSILNEDQKTRFKQIQWQAVAYDAMRDPAVIRELAVSPEQQEQMKELLSNLTQSFDRSYKFSAKETESIMKEFNKSILGVLSEEQRSKFATMRGKEFDFCFMRRP